MASGNQIGSQRRPNFNALFVNGFEGFAEGATLSSATTVTPTASLHVVSGTTEVDTITVPNEYASYGGRITFIPTGAFTTGTSGNIAIASTAVVGKALTNTYLPSTGKFYPSY